MRYGQGDDYFYDVWQGVGEIPCGLTYGWVWPFPDENKACAYTERNVLGLSEASTFSYAAAEGETFTQAQPGLYWVRFGTGGSWLYNVIEGGNAQSMPCTGSYFGWDPAQHQAKECQIGGLFASNSGNEELTECATEGSSCTTGPSPVLAQYGADGSYTYQFTHRAGETFPCTSDFFNSDPKKKTHKRCYFTDVPSKEVETAGDWRKVLSCDGPDCPIQYRLSVGTTRTNSWTTSDQWGYSVTTSVESGFSVSGSAVKVTESAAYSYAHSEAFTDALAESVNEWFTATCDPNGTAQRRAIYQFTTETDEACLESANCTGATQTAEYVCAIDAPSGYAGPQCVPGYCGDALCTVCDYPGES